MGTYLFSSCDRMTDIYCEAESQPSGWPSWWWIGTFDKTVHFGVASMK